MALTKGEGCPRSRILYSLPRPREGTSTFVWMPTALKPSQGQGGRNLHRSALGTMAIFAHKESAKLRSKDPIGGTGHNESVSAGRRRAYFSVHPERLASSLGGRVRAKDTMLRLSQTPRSLQACRQRTSPYWAISVSASPDWLPGRCGRTLVPDGIYDSHRRPNISSHVRCAKDIGGDFHLGRGPFQLVRPGQRA